MTTQHDCREEADRFRPKFVDLRNEGLSPNAITAVYRVRDMFHAGRSADDIAAWLVDFAARNPVWAFDVWPGGIPVHWLPCEECRLAMAFDDHDLCGREGDAPVEQWQVTTPEAVWA